MARHGNWVREEPAREPIQVLTQDLVDHAAAALFEHGAVSLKALRLFLQRRTSTNLISMRTGIRQLAEQTVESMTGSLDVQTLPAQGLAEIRKIAVWEPVPVDLEKHGRGRCLFHSLNDHCGESAKSWGNHGDVQKGNLCWGLFCLERGIQPDGQVPSAKTVGDDDVAFTTCFPVTGGSQQVPHGTMVDLWPMVADDVHTGTSGPLLHTELLTSGTLDAVYRGCHTLQPKFVGSALEGCGGALHGHGTACWESSFLECGGRASKTIGDGRACNSGSASGLGFPLLERLLLDWEVRQQWCSPAGAGAAELHHRQIA